MSNSPRGCFKLGCFGCLAMIILAVLATIMLAFMGQVMGSTVSEPVDVEFSHPLSPDAGPVEAETSGGFGETSSTLEAVPSSDQAQLGTILPMPEAVVAPEPRPGRLVVDLAYGDFKIRRGSPGEGLKVEAKYDASAFELEEVLTEDGDKWTYNVSFGPKNGVFGLLLRSGVKEGDNKITITVPADHPIDLVGEMGVGELEADLGGLWLRQIDLDLGVGEHTLSFAEPTREPMERFAVVGSVGEIKIRDLGNASPRQVYFEHSIGEARLDLSGEWQNDAEVTASFSIGEMRLRLPDDVKIVLSDKKVSIGEITASDLEDRQLEPDAHTLTLAINGSIGELSID